MAVVASPAMPWSTPSVEPQSQTAIMTARNIVGVIVYGPTSLVLAPPTWGTGGGGPGPGASETTGYAIGN